MMSMSYCLASCETHVHSESGFTCCSLQWFVILGLIQAPSETDLVHFLLPLRGHGGPGGVAAVGDGVEDLGSGAARLVDLRGVPARQHVFQGRRDHAVLVAGNVDQVATQRLELSRTDRELDRGLDGQKILVQSL